MIMSSQEHTLTFAHYHSIICTDSVICTVSVICKDFFFPRECSHSGNEELDLQDYRETQSIRHSFEPSMEELEKGIWQRAKPPKESARATRRKRAPDWFGGKNGSRQGNIQMEPEGQASILSQTWHQRLLPPAGAGPLTYPQFDCTSNRSCGAEQKPIREWHVDRPNFIPWSTALMTSWRGKGVFECCPEGLGLGGSNRWNALKMRLDDTEVCVRPGSLANDARYLLASGI